MSRILFLTLLVLALGVNAADAEVAMFDDFNDNQTNTSLWTSNSDETGGVSLAETNGRLEISFASTASGDTFEAGYRSQMALSGDFDLQVDYELLGWPYANGVRVGLGVSSLNVSYLVERMSFGSEASGDFPYVPSRDNYLSHSWGAGVTTVTTDDLAGTLRLTRVGNILSYYYYGDSDWELISSVSATTADLNFLLSAWSHERFFSDAPVTVAFDNVRLDPVPEPSTFVLLVIGTFGAMFWRTRKRG